MRKVAALLIIFIVMCSFCRTNIWACENENCMIDVEPENYDEEEAKKVIEYYYNMGKSVLKQRTVYTLSMPHYYQNAGNVWDTDTMQTDGDTISKSGCCLTSFSMMVCYYKNSTMYNPRVVNNMLGIYACPFAFEDAGNACGLTTEGGTALRENMNFNTVVPVVAALIKDKQCPVLLGMTKGSTTHFVVARGYSTTTGDIYIYDPDVYKDYYNLSDYYSDGYIVNRCYSYVPNN